MMTEGDQILGDDHSMQYTNDVLQNGAFETYIMILINAISINLILK